MSRDGNLRFKNFVELVLFIIICTLSYLLYKYNVLFYNSIAIYLAFIIHKVKKIKLNYKILCFFILLLFVNYYYLMEPPYLTIVRDLGKIKFMINDFIVSATNLILCSFILCSFYKYLQIEHKGLFNKLLETKSVNILTLLTLIICFFSYFILPKLPNLPFFHIMLYATLIAIMIILTFSKTTALLIVPSYLLSLLFSFILVVIFYMVLNLAYIPPNRYFFMFEFTPYFYLQITTIITLILWMVPQKIYSKNNKFIAVKLIALFCTLMVVTFFRWYQPFLGFFDELM